MMCKDKYEENANNSYYEYAVSACSVECIFEQISNQ